MRLLFLLVLLAACLANGVAARRPAHYVSAHVYLYGWDIQTRSRLSLDDVRRMSKVTVAIEGADRAIAFERSLNLDALAPRTEPVSDEPRLVIDLARSDGTSETFYANDFYLFSEDGTRLRKIDICFQRRFELLPPGDCE